MVCLLAASPQATLLGSLRHKADQGNGPASAATSRVRWLRTAALAGALSASLVAAGCSSGPGTAPAPTPAPPESTSSTTTTAPLTLSEIVAAQEPPDWEYRTRRQVDEVSNAVAEAVWPTFRGGEHAGKLPLLDERLSQAVDDLFVDFFQRAADADAALSEEPPEQQPEQQPEKQSALTVTVAVTMAAPHLVAVEFTAIETIVGAARPNLDYVGVVWSLAEGRELLGSELAVTDSAFAALGAMVLDEVTRQYSGQGVRRSDLNLDAFVAGFASIVPTDRGLRVSFGRDELLPGAFGEGARVTLGWDSVDQLVIEELAVAFEAPQGTARGRPQVRPLLLRPDGIEELPFGWDPDATVARVVQLLGPPDDDSGFAAGESVCDAPPADRVRQVRWGSFELTFTPEQGFVEWYVADAGNDVLAATSQQVGVGSSVGAVEAAYPAALKNGVKPLFPEDPDSEFGLFQVQGENATMFGVTDTLDDDGLVVDLWAGQGCGRVFA